MSTSASAGRACGIRCSGLNGDSARSSAHELVQELPVFTVHKEPSHARPIGMIEAHVWGRPDALHNLPDGVLHLHLPLVHAGKIDDTVHADVELCYLLLSIEHHSDVL